MISNFIWIGIEDDDVEVDDEEVDDVEVDDVEVDVVVDSAFIAASWNAAHRLEEVPTRKCRNLFVFQVFVW